MLSFTIPRRFCSNSSIMQRMCTIMPQRQQYFKDWKKRNANKVIQEKITVGQIFGMKNIISMLCETSRLEPKEGIRYREHKLKSLVRQLPKTAVHPAATAKETLQPLPEGALWLLLTGEMPTKEQVVSVSRDLLARTELPPATKKIIDSYPSYMQPMVQLSGAVLSMSPYSKFRKAYAERVDKKDLWKFTLDDGLDLIARTLSAAARINRNLFGKQAMENHGGAEDLSAFFSRQMGFDSFEFFELMRLYLTIHADHEAGNVSSHTCHLVNSSLSDPYMSFSAAINGLAGPLHGLANQEVLEWIKELDGDLSGEKLTIDNVAAYVNATLDSGRVVPGFGHAVLRVTDPRYICQREFAKLYMDESDRLYKIVKMLYEVVPGILSEMGKVKCPFPNVDGHSGVLLNHFGMTQTNFYTVLFAVSRSIGSMASITMSRAYGLPIERPKSVTTRWISENIE